MRKDVERNKTTAWPPLGLRFVRVLVLMVLMVWVLPLLIEGALTPSQLVSAAYLLLVYFLLTGLAPRLWNQVKRFKRS